MLPPLADTLSDFLAEVLYYYFAQAMDAARQTLNLAGSLSLQC